MAREDPRPPDHPAVARGRVGVLLINLGTPEAPTVPAVRAYLSEFLSDPRVVELPPALWKPILNGAVLTIRPPKTARLYASIWDQVSGDSPLRAITRAQAAALGHAFGPAVEVDWAMRYGYPSIPEQLTALQSRGCDRILVAPLYPQYSAATTATAVDRAHAALARKRWQPTLRTLPPYYDAPAYIEALATTLTQQLAELPFTPDAVLASFHGMPRRTLLKGDPYHCHCHKTARLLRERLGWPAPKLRVSFQSRFGRGEWLRPYTDELLGSLPSEGVRKLAVLSPGFAADCLETLEELAIRGRETFIEAGGTEFAYLPCLNAEPAGIAMLTELLARELAGWVELPKQAFRNANREDQPWQEQPS